MTSISLAAVLTLSLDSPHIPVGRYLSGGPSP